MKKPKRYSCGNGEGMFEDDKNGHWVEYSEHKAIVDALTEKLRQPLVSRQGEQFKCGKCNSNWGELRAFCFNCGHESEDLST